MKRTRKRQLLRELKKALNACDRAGIHLKLGHGIVFTDMGYIMPIGKKDEWVIRRVKKHFNYR